MTSAVNRWLTLDIQIPEDLSEIAMEHAMSLGATAVLEQERAFQVSYPDDQAGRTALAALKTYLSGLDSRVTFQESEVERENWNLEWQKYFNPVMISERIAILPEWVDSSGFKQSIIIRIRPAMAFGTGTHETTQLCLKLLEQSVSTGDRVLDLGTGSGILGITELQLGAAQVDGVDIDPLVEENARENMALNGISSGFRLQISDAPKLNGGYDLMVVNMVRARLFPLLPDYFDQVRTGGSVVISGLLREEEGALQDILKQSAWKIERKLAMNEWIAFICSVK